MSDIRCTTPSCVSAIERYGEHYHKVDPIKTAPPDAMPDATHRCSMCGGYTNGKDWVHQCASCDKLLGPGELKGLFVPHLCADCEQAAADDCIRRGHVCTLCRKPYSRCCC